MSTKMSTNTPASELGYWQLLRDTKIDFLKFKGVAFFFSALLCALGIYASIQIFVTGDANLGIEFTGGTTVTLEFEQPIHLDDARALLMANGYSNPQVTNAQDSESKLIIRVKEGDVAEVPEEIASIFERQHPDNAIIARSSTSIGPAVGNELRDKAVYAIIYALIGIILYIAVRFDFKFGVTAAIGMFHDVLIIVGLMWLKDLIVPTEFTLLIMTAVLTMAGYSLTDKVVVFDRIRENIKRRTKTPLPETINSSINQVLSRTIVVSLTTFLVSAAIYFLGGEVLHNFALALMIGVATGTYSSIFIASPMLTLWGGGKGKLMGEAVNVRGKGQGAKSNA